MESLIRCMISLVHSQMHILYLYCRNEMLIIMGKTVGRFTKRSFSRTIIRDSLILFELKAAKLDTMPEKLSK